MSAENTPQKWTFLQILSQHEEHYSKLANVGRISDLEQIKYLGRTQGFCPYFYEKYCKNIANIILMPYIYLLDERSLKGQQLGQIIQNSIIIFDEGHNIPSACESSKQFSINLSTLSRALHHISDLRQQKLGEGKRKMSEKSKEQGQKDNFLKSSLNQLQLHASFISLIHPYFQTLQISLQQGLLMNTHDFLQCLDNGTESGEFGKLSTKIQKLLQSGQNIKNDILLKAYWALENWLQFLFKVSEMYKRKQFSSQLTCFKIQLKYNGSDIQINLFCLDPKVGFENVMKMNPYSVILTSGTLSPLNSIPLELGIEFNRPLACPHIMSKQQVNGCILTKGPNKLKLNFNYENRNNLELYKQIGLILYQIAGKTPNGVIIFIPSYSLMQKIKNQLTNSGLMSKLYSKKNIYFEKSNSADFKQILQKYLEDAVKSKGAMLFALARGKISEGLDFSDEKCRAVVMIGVPYPAAKDVKVVSKMQYLDKKSEESKSMNGNQWYICETIRCINQSIGRIIRNKFDYGSIYLIDQRFRKPQLFSQISTWARQCLKIVEDFEEFKFKLNIFEQYFRKKNRQTQEVQHFFTSHLGTKLTSKIGQHINVKNNEINLEKNISVISRPKPDDQRESLKKLLMPPSSSVAKVVEKEEQIKKPTLERIIFGKKNKLSSQPQIKECPVCRISRPLIKNTECIHTICEQCWDIWLKKDLRCPLCRVRIRQKYLIKP